MTFEPPCAYTPRGVDIVGRRRGLRVLSLYMHGSEQLAILCLLSYMLYVYV